MAEATTEPRKITFEGGYDRMKEISSDLESPDLTVAEMCDHYKEGKALGKALLAYLDEREGELKEIDEGNNLPRFKITATAEADDPNSGDVPADTSEFATSEPGVVGASDDDIPF